MMSRGNASTSTPRERKTFIRWWPSIIVPSGRALSESLKPGLKDSQLSQSESDLGEPILPRSKRCPGGAALKGEAVKSYSLQMLVASARQLKLRLSSTEICASRYGQNSLPAPEPTNPAWTPRPLRSSFPRLRLQSSLPACKRELRLAERNGP